MEIAVTEEGYGPTGIHPLAEEMPPLSEADYAALKESLRLHGWQPNSWCARWQGKVIDGRHRVRACRELNDEGVRVGPRFLDLNLPDEDAVKLWIIDQHLGRRNLTTSQKSILVAERARLVKHGGDRGNQYTGGKLQSCNLAKMAEDAGVSYRSACAGKKVLDNDPSLAESVKRGEVTVTEAERRVRERIGGAKPSPRRSEAQIAKQLDDALAVLDGTSDWPATQRRSLAEILAWAADHPHDARMLASMMLGTKDP